MREYASAPIQAWTTFGHHVAVAASRAAHRAASDDEERQGNARLPPPDRSVCCPCCVRRVAAARFLSCPADRRMCSFSCSGSIQDLRDMDELYGDVVSLGAAALVHEAGAVGRDDIIGFCLRKILDLVGAHLRRHTLVEDGKQASEAAALVGPRRGHQFEPIDLGQQRLWLGEMRLPQFRSPSMTQTAEGAAAVVQTHFVRKARPRERIDLQY